jgi:polyphosphate kinase 2 (PPK2 family)
VFRVDVKTIKGPTKEDLLDAVLKTIPDTTITISEMDEIIRQNQEKCLLILDGLDEAGLDSRESTNKLFAGTSTSKQL